MHIWDINNFMSVPFFFFGPLKVFEISVDYGILDGFAFKPFFFFLFEIFLIFAFIVVFHAFISLRQEIEAPDLFDITLFSNLNISSSINVNADSVYDDWVLLHVIWQHILAHLWSNMVLHMLIVNSFVFTMLREIVSPKHSFPTTLTTYK